MVREIAEIIRTELNRFPGEPLAEKLRAAAWFAMDEYPTATSKDFGDAAALCDLHRQGARNRWNEAKQNLEIAG